jgi:hypothetical protein
LRGFDERTGIEAGQTSESRSFGGVQTAGKSSANCPGLRCAGEVLVKAQLSKLSKLTSCVASMDVRVLKLGALMNLRSFDECSSDEAAQTGQFALLWLSSSCLRQRAYLKGIGPKSTIRRFSRPLWR